eukprot:4195078-Prymnesium_polylepis.2
MPRWNGVDVVMHAHVTGHGGPQDLQGSWSEPLNASTNVLCSLNTSDAERRCPRICAATHGVRKR